MFRKLNYKLNYIQIKSETTSMQIHNSNQDFSLNYKSILDFQSTLLLPPDSYNNLFK